MSSFLDAAGRLVKQGLAGALTNYTSPMKDSPGPALAPFPGGPSPSIFSKRDYTETPQVVAGAPGLVSGAVSGAYKLLQAGTDLVPKQYLPYRLYVPALEDASNSYLKSEALVNKETNTPEPTNMAETGARVFGNIIGSPEVPVIGKATTIPQKVGKVVGELMLPGRQGGMKTATSAAVLGSSLAEIGQTLSPSTDYKTISSQMKKGIVQPQLRAKPVEDYLTPQTMNDYNHAVETNDVQTQDEILGAVAALQDEDAKASYLPPIPWWQTDEAKQTAAIAATAVAGMFGVRVLKNTKAKLMTGSSELVGQDVVPHLADATTKATQGVVQNDHMIRAATSHATGDKGRLIGQSRALQQWNAKLDMVTNPAIHSKQQHFAMTGELPNSTTTTVPLGPLLDGIEKGLDPTEKALLSDGLLAGTALDDYKRFGTQTSFTHDKQGNPVSTADIQHIYDLVQNDAKLKPIADTIRQHYRGQLDYMKEHGIISQDQYQGFIENGPNFVHMSKNEAPDTVRSLWSRGDNSNVASDRRANMLGSRSSNTGGGVTAGAAADPISELPSQWARLIREVEIHNVKKQWLEFANQSPELQQWVKKLPLGVEPEGDPAKIHTVFENGMAHNYYIKDPALSEALNFQPFAQSNALSAGLNVIRRNFENFTTGAGNPFFAPVAASYDTFTGMALKPEGYNLGVLNEILAHLNPKASIGNLDPTWIVSAPIGAARHGWDSLVGAMGNGLARELSAGKGPVLDLLGPNITQGLEAKLSNMYAASIKSQMDEAGIANANLFASDRPDRVAPGLHEIAPNFATGVAARAFRDALKGDHSIAQQMLAGSHYAFEATRAAPLARLYSGVLKSIHEGFRYQAYATNLPRIVDKDSAELIASQTRRIAADIGQKGAGELAQTGMNAVTYANAGMQSLAQVARMFRDNPLNFSLNTTTALLGLASLYYGPALISKENRDKMRNFTAEQRMASFPTFGGLEVKVPPELRPIWGSVTAILDDASGLNTVNPDGSDSFNPNFASAIQTWLDNGLSEEGQQDFKQNVKEGLWGAAPATWGSSPILNSVMAASSGLDIAYSRYTGSPQTIEPQKIDPLGGEGEYTDDAISANWQKAIEDVSGIMLGGYVRAGLDVQRALKDDHTTLDQAVRVGVSRVVDTGAKQTGPGSIIFGDYERKLSPNDGAMKLYQKKKVGFQKATEILNKDILTPFTDGKDPRSASISALDTLDLAHNQDLLGTTLVPIGAVAAQVLKSTQPIEQQITNIKKQIDEIGNQKATTIEDRNKQINDLNEKRKQLIQVETNFYRMGEDTIRSQIGDPTFTFQDFGDHFADYKKKAWPPAPQPVPQPSEHETPPTVQ